VIEVVLTKGETGVLVVVVVVGKLLIDVAVTVDELLVVEVELVIVVGATVSIKVVNA
jgi:hypothetical protein